MTRESRNYRNPFIVSGQEDRILGDLPDDTFERHGNKERGWFSHRSATSSCNVFQRSSLLDAFDFFRFLFLFPQLNLFHEQSMLRDLDFSVVGLFRLRMCVISSVSISRSTLHGKESEAFIAAIVPLRITRPPLFSARYRRSDLLRHPGASSRYDVNVIDQCGKGNRKSQSRIEC